MKHLIITTERENYAVEDVRGMTVGELIDKLREFDRNSIVALRMDSGMYGGVHNGYGWGYDVFVERTDPEPAEDEDIEEYDEE